MVMQTRRITEDDGILLIDDAVQQRLRLRVRREVVAFLADLADASRPDRGAGTVAFNSLIDYPTGTVGGRLKAIITGIGEGQPWADVAALLDDLTGLIDIGQLHADLQATLDLITADVNTANSVNARVSAEAQARSLALLAEAQDRATAISNAIGELQTTIVAAYEGGDETINSRITTEVGLSQDRDSALGVRIDTVSARLDSGDIFSALATASTYAYTKAATDSAIAASASSLTTTFQLGDSTLNTRITEEATASSDRDTALGSRVDTVTARLDSGDIAATLATLASYAYTKAQSDSAMATLGSTLRSEFNPINARLDAGGDIHASLATANSYAYTKAAVDGAFADQATSLTSAFTLADGAIAARLDAGGDIYNSLATANTYAYTKAQSDNALSSLSTSLTSSFSNADAAINARLNSGDIAAAIADASSYAYTKAQADSAIASSASTLRSEFNPINARLNAGGDIYSSLSTALNYAYTKAASDSALASQASTLRAEYSGPLGSLNSSVSILQTAVAGTNGLQAQFALKTIATRSDGKPVLGYVGLASTAPNDGTGASELILQADRILFVPSSDVNASPAQMMTLGLVNGVATLIVPAARIGDSTVTPQKMSVPNLAAITADLGAVTAGTITLNSSGYIRGGQTDYDSGVGFFLGRGIASNDFCLSLRADDGSSLTFSKTGGLQISGATINTSATGPMANAGDLFANMNGIRTGSAVYVGVHIELRRDGSIWKYEADGIVGTQWFQIGNWYLPATATIGDQYQVLFTRTGGSSSTGFATSAGSWTDLNASRYVMQEISTTDAVSMDSGGTFQVRRKTDSVVVCSGTWYLSLAID